MEATLTRFGNPDGALYLLIDRPWQNNAARAIDRNTDHYHYWEPRNNPRCWSTRWKLVGFLLAVSLLHPNHGDAKNCAITTKGWSEQFIRLGTKTIKCWLCFPSWSWTIAWTVTPDIRAKPHSTVWIEISIFHLYLVFKIIGYIWRMISAPLVCYNYPVCLTTFLIPSTSATQLIKFPAVFRICIKKWCRLETDSWTCVATAVSQTWVQIPAMFSWIIKTLSVGTSKLPNIFCSNLLNELFLAKKELQFRQSCLFFGQTILVWGSPQGQFSSW